MGEGEGRGREGMGEGGDEEREGVGEGVGEGRKGGRGLEKSLERQCNEYDKSKSIMIK